MIKYLLGVLGLLLATGMIVVLSISPAMAQRLHKNDYVVGPGDVLDIQVWDNDDLNRTIEVSQKGAFTFPFIGKINALKLSVFDLERLLIRKLSDGYLVAPQVTITISEYRNQKVFLFGQVRRPGMYMLKHHMHILELISEAGGFTEQRGSLCTIVRPEAEAGKKVPTLINDAKKSEIIHVDLDQLISGAVHNLSAYVMPGDSIYISESEKIFVTGEVRLPGKLKWEKGLTVRQAVSLAGGGTARASVNRIRIIRNVDGVEKKIKPNLGDPVLPNDIIKVPESFF